MPAPTPNPIPRPRPRKDGTICWQVRYRITRDGRRVAASQPFDDLAEAERFAKILAHVGAEQAEKYLAARVAADAAPAITISEWLRRYADRLTGIEDETRRKYHRMIDLDVDPFMGELPIDAYTDDLDAAWVDHLVNETGNAPKTVANKHGFVSAAMAAARHRPTPLVPSNPCAYTRLLPVHGRRRDYFTLLDMGCLRRLGR
ncbi:hypothetical protein [Nocardia otitidiscaviarum]|uniref:hypothetical protein n=1 Tax=Nocardia otitidiscaviarum TaxID=1823 RepID=UPI002457F804|nr:hypothetical protein [Nocardia otitidiscaviarum]